MFWKEGHSRESKTKLNFTLEDKGARFHGSVSDTVTHSRLVTGGCTHLRPSVSF